MKLRLPDRCAWVLLTLATCHAVTASAQETVHPWQRVGAGLERIYAWPNVSFHISAAAVTPPLALWVDEPVQEGFQEHDPLGDTFGPVTLVFGAIAPLAVLATFYLNDLTADDSELTTASAATVQAVVIQAVVVTTLKWSTDRAGPYPDGDPQRRRWVSRYFRDSKSATDFNFNPFDLEGGLRWPSGHTASAISIVSALVAFYPSEPWIAAIGYPIVLAVGVGMLEGDYHWLSDVVAGALIGHAIGWQVGREFRATYEARKAHREAPSAHVATQELTLAPSPLGLGISGVF